MAWMVSDRDLMEAATNELVVFMSARSACSCSMASALMLKTISLERDFTGREGFATKRAGNLIRTQITAPPLTHTVGDHHDTKNIGG